LHDFARHVEREQAFVLAKEDENEAVEEFLGFFKKQEFGLRGVELAQMLEEAKAGFFEFFVKIEGDALLLFEALAVPKIEFAFLPGG
jgi:hypothetical protein